MRKDLLKAVLKLFWRAVRWNPAYPVLLLFRTVIEILMPFPGIIFPAMIIEHQGKYSAFRRTRRKDLGLSGAGRCPEDG